MLLVLTFLLNAAMNFATGLAVAAVLGPEEFGQFGIASMIAIVLGTSLFDWLRLSATRHYNEQSRDNDPGLRSSLDFTYAAGGLVLAAGALIAALFNLVPWLSSVLIFTIAATAFANVQFDYWSALARARFLNRAYARLVIFKNASSLVLMVAAGHLFHSSAFVLIALCVSVAAAIASVWPRLHDARARLTLVQRDRIIGFARYGFPIVIANVLYQIIVLANRWMIARRLGLADAGQLSLATDMTIRLFLSAGAGLDVLLFQTAVRLEATHGMSPAQTQIARNMVAVLAALLPMACGYAVILPHVESLLVPAPFHGAFSTISLMLIPGVICFCLTQFAFAPVLQLAHRTVPLIWAALAGALCDFVLLTMLPPAAPAAHYAAVHSISLLAASVVAAVYAYQIRDSMPSWRDIARVCLAAGLMMVAILPLRGIASPWLGLISSVATGIVVYAVSIVMLNVFELRTSLWLRIKTKRALI